ncbi:NACHT domain-containing protein [Methylocella tundrae]|uniref:NACHT domain-containing protein n=1 Tax=Methylocella tundrae TaxID=227605 RepID=A0A4U8Z2F5_METTU|nr:NACHT domain-containing protein [Methylocella tundrae]WPP03410.1 NACHT domain-containing protein [Methylocella tundrae]VFU09470.1 NACHT domain-containing protein [Methylocella tundrae]
MQPKWKTFEEQVRGIAELIFWQPCLPGRIAGVNFDGVIQRGELETVVIEISQQNDLEKVRQGITRMTLARQTLSAEGVLLRGYIVLSKVPTQAMLDAATAAKLTVGSAGQFAALFFQFPIYKNARVAASFGSSIDPITGRVDAVSYVPVMYERVDGGKELSIADLAEILLSGRNVILLGEFGAGKSRCVREVFNALAENWNVTFKFPFAVNLRECWGLDRADEIVRRGITLLGLDDLAGPAVRALNRDSLILLLDGFDELGSQSWSTDESRLRQLRARALKGVKDLVGKTKSGCLVAGREHYFSSNEEMMTALGLTKANAVIVKAKDEFTSDELEAYFDAAGLIVELPSWLPKRPLICQTIALLSDDELGSMFGITSEGVEFWNHFMKVVCQRDARINAFFDADTIYRVFVALSRITRRRPANIGPISQRDLQDAFEAVVGQLPVEEASAMLQRLPSLGRIGAESQDRQFVDMFILDGLRAKDVAGLPEIDEAKRQHVFTENWINPLGTLGQTILAVDIKGRIEPYRQIASRASARQNPTLAADITSAMTRVDTASVDMQGLNITGGAFTELALNNTPLGNLVISEATIERLVLPNSPPTNLTISKSLAGSVSGAASYAGLPSWVQLETVDRFDSVQTVAQIKKAGLSPAHEIFVAILKKTFKQKGAGRKEEALLRGFGAGASKKLASSILNILMQEEILTRHKGDEGWIYSPSRSQGPRITTILEQLRSSTDPLWSMADTLNK